MPPTEPPDPPNGDSTPSPASKGGRPGVSFERVQNEVDAWIARTGHAPSVRELRTALGGTGSLTTLGRHLRDVLADRLLVGAEPDRGSAEAILIKSMKAAMGVLAGEAAGAAEDAIAQGAREADSRIAAAQGLQSRAEARAEVAAQEREHALGRASTLHDQVTSLRTEVADVRQALADSQAREVNGKTQINDLEQSLKNVQDKLQQLEERHTLDQEQLTQSNHDAQAAQDELSTTKEALSRIISERDTAQATITVLQAALQQAEKRVTTAETQLANSMADHDATRELLSEMTERQAAAETARALAEASAKQALKERESLVAEQDRLSEIRDTLVLLQSDIKSSKR